MSDKLFIIIPAYNEEANIASVIEEWYPIVEKYNGDGHSRLVIVDDGSRDSTLRIATDEVRKREYLEVITKDNGGHGSSIYFGYQYALQEGADYIFQTDSDGQTLASEFDAFWRERAGYDVIIGNRVSRGDGAVRKLVSGCVRTVVKIIFGVKAEDINTPYRLMEHDALERALKYVPEEYNLTNIALTAIALRLMKADVNAKSVDGVAPKRIRVKFMPITFKPRQGGKNSINIRKIIVIGIKAISDLSKIAKSLNE